MPIKLRNPKVRISEELSESQWQYLLTGTNWNTLAHKPEFASAEDERQAYIDNYDDIMEFWLQDLFPWVRDGKANRSGTYGPGGLFSRPFCWWRWEDLPEPRRIIGTDKYDPDDDDEVGEPIYETEYAYLLRNRALLFDVEKEELERYGISTWRQMPVSELTTLDQFVTSEGFRRHLEPNEAEALREYANQHGLQLTTPSGGRLFEEEDKF